MEGFRQRDEFEHIKRKLPAQTARLELVTPITKPLRELSHPELDVVQAALNGATFRALLDASALTDLEVAVSVIGLIDKGYVKKP